jgi:hypothetical protein
MQSESLEAHLWVDHESNLSDEALERCSRDNRLSLLLVPLDLTDGNSAWSEAMGLLDAANRRGGLSSSSVERRRRRNRSWVVDLALRLSVLDRSCTSDT